MFIQFDFFLLSGITFALKFLVWAEESRQALSKNKIEQTENIELFVDLLNPEQLFKTKCIKVALIPQRLRYESIRWVLLVEDEFSADHLRVFSIVVHIRRKDAKPQRNCREYFLDSVCIISDALWCEFEEIGQAVCLLEEEQSTVFSKEIVKEVSTLDYKFVYLCIILRLVLDELLGNPSLVFISCIGGSNWARLASKSTDMSAPE